MSISKDLFLAILAMDSYKPAARTASVRIERDQCRPDAARDPEVSRRSFLQDQFIECQI